MDLLKETYFKYRPLDNFERFLDIIVNKRLYGAYYFDLNDPMEGKFNHTGLEKAQLKEIYSLLKQTRICSMMLKDEDHKFPNNPIMWSHYADSHRGCCLEIGLTGRNNPGWTLTRVNYSDLLPNPGLLYKDSVKNIVSAKSCCWDNENEVRAFKVYSEYKSSNLSPFYYVKISSVYLGKKISATRRRFIKRIVQSIDSSINVYYMDEEFAKQDFYPILTPKEV